ncbi:FHA domain-containing protein [Actinomadura macrotermitis]|uniref:FHA domain-containing protein n=1 Tax=Actinomadura macrotermitis TaxID=2585200 RepID=A0A7K0BP57_9ACTN|nr:FHA domain-containing protein [Actinomadura macrotermitis]MQY02978.1 hypothetical protein [Actinomadura macrotermitis]
MAICPAGHSSGSDDYCDVCGEQIGAAGAAAPAAPPAATATLSAPAASALCPDCGTPGTDRFCEDCGYDFATGGGKPTPPPVPAPPVPAPPVPAPPVPAPPVPAPPVPAPPVPLPPVPAPPLSFPAQATWTAVVGADRAYYDSLVEAEGPDAAAIVFPPYCPERRIPLAGPQVRIGRRGSSGAHPPEIDLREPPEDPGVSHTHAVLLARPDGGWSLVDPGSRNRTCLNGSLDPIPLNVEVPVGDGDRIHVGAWTTIRLLRNEAS